VARYYAAKPKQGNFLVEFTIRQLAQQIGEVIDNLALIRLIDVRQNVHQETIFCRHKIQKIFKLKLPYTDNETVMNPTQLKVSYPKSLFLFHFFSTDLSLSKYVQN